MTNKPDPEETGKLTRPRPDEFVVLDAWDRLAHAIMRVETALPFQMSAAITNLEAQRKAFGDILMGRAALSQQDASK